MILLSFCLLCHCRETEREKLKNRKKTKKKQEKGNTQQWLSSLATVITPVSLLCLPLHHHHHHHHIQSCLSLQIQVRLSLHDAPLCCFPFFSFFYYPFKLVHQEIQKDQEIHFHSIYITTQNKLSSHFDILLIKDHLSFCRIQ